LNLLGHHRAARLRLGNLTVNVTARHYGNHQRCDQPEQHPITIHAVIPIYEKIGVQTLSQKTTLWKELLPRRMEFLAIPDYPA
jgi:hypothetical protein